jgi:glycosyltransferase involved in cell wall biosynthesis
MNELSPEIFAEVNKHLFNQEQKNLCQDVATILSYLKTDHISDYSFLVSPVAKAYEGYLKDFFLHINIIDQYAYKSDRFRVGKTLNPSLRYKRFSIYQKLIDLDEKGEELAETLWTAWKYGRNEIFHYFPGNLRNLDRSEAENRISLVFKAIIDSGKFLKVHIKNHDLDPLI